MMPETRPGHGATQADWAVLQLGHAYDEASNWSAKKSPLLSTTG